MEILTALIVALTRLVWTPILGPTTPLGGAGLNQFSVQEIYTPVSGRINALTLRFVSSRSGRSISSEEFEVGQSIGMANALCVGYYTQESRKQVFVSTEMGEVVSLLLDYDGKRVRVLYKGGEGVPSGRVRAFPTWDESGNFGIREQFWLHSKIVNGKSVSVTPYSVTRTVHIKRN